MDNFKMENRFRKFSISAGIIALIQNALFFIVFVVIVGGYLLLFVGFFNLLSAGQVNILEEIFKGEDATILGLSYLAFIAVIVVNFILGIRICIVSSGDVVDYKYAKFSSYSIILLDIVQMVIVVFLALGILSGNGITSDAILLVLLVAGIVLFIILVQIVLMIISRIVCTKEYNALPPEEDEEENVN